MINRGSQKKVDIFNLNILTYTTGQFLAYNLIIW